jgi:chromosome segregation ATPase
MVLIGLGAVGCTEPIDQNVKNQVFTLSARWSTTSDSLDALERKLLIARTVGRRNKQELGGIVGAQQDSADEAHARKLYEQYLQHLSRFDALMSQVADLQQQYVASHKAYNRFQAKVEKNQLTTSEARSRMTRFQGQRQEVNRQIRNLYPKVQQAITQHNGTVNQLNEIATERHFDKISDT